ncbi:hypothetical protein NIES970_06750 [[Synechococcus] sp. NIES-970]|uniref:hypothetical protein n=1 Tax=Picosynechococcus sp. NKBG15041c TaxID=1407650 RepID=UPI00057192C3|nr:hypothetical protein [Picosynechococcus sp. NKBG15041c]BAW95762.1 hypothetical protein NIES970_06750 [[Synechococcus] sp. NIES-970]
MIESVSSYSTSGLLMMHGGIRQSLAVDDNLPKNMEKLYGVRQYSGWRKWADKIEAELDARQIKYTKIA